MEAIRNYLETMFLNLPNTPEVYKAKNELWQMMEDKYTELKNEGKSENEAVGTVIAEFGNLDELAEDLGIKQFVHQPRQEQTPNAVSLSMEDVRQFLREHSRHSYFVALSIFLFILSACCPIFFGAAADTSLRSSDVLDASGIILMFVFIAIGVGMLVYSNVCMGHWKHLEEGNFVTDFATTDYIHHEMEHYKSTHALLLTIGIMLCILSVVPPILLDAASSFAADTLEDCSAGFVLIFVAIGVFLIVISSMRMGGYRTLLHLNNQNTIGGNYVPEQQDRQQRGQQTFSVHTITSLKSFRKGAPRERNAGLPFAHDPFFHPSRTGSAENCLKKWYHFNLENARGFPLFRTVFRNGRKPPPVRVDFPASRC